MKSALITKTDIGQGKIMKKDKECLSCENFFYEGCGKPPKMVNFSENNHKCINYKPSDTSVSHSDAPRTHLIELDDKV